MRKLLIFLLLVPTFSFGQQTISLAQILQFTGQLTTPLNPPSNSYILYVNSSGTLTCTTSSGISCLGGGLPTGLTFSAPTLTVSTAGSGNGVLALSGNTSGTATFTAPAIAGTTTNRVVSSNNFQAPLFGFPSTGCGGSCFLDANATGNGITIRAASTTNVVLTATGGPSATFSSSADTFSVGGYLSNGTTFTSSGGCAEGTLVGGATMGKFTTSGSTGCTTTITMGNSVSSAHGWECIAHDLTTVGDVSNPHLTSSNTTTATIATGTIVSGDVISFACWGY